MSDEVVETSFGKFLVNPKDCIGMTTKAGTLWDGAGFLQPIATEYALSQPGSTVIDVGANIGTFSVWLAIQGVWRVIAVEPVPETMRYLKANLDLNKVDCASRVIPLEMAAYSRSTRMAFDTFDPDNLGATALLRRPDGPIEGDRLDHWAHVFGPRVSLIKVDAQGSDYQALLGLDETIRKHQPAIVFEWEADLAAAHGDRLEDAVSWLSAVHRYTVYPWPCYPTNFLALPRSA